MRLFKNSKQSHSLSLNKREDAFRLNQPFETPFFEKYRILLILVGLVILVLLFVWFKKPATAVDAAGESNEAVTQTARAALAVKTVKMRRTLLNVPVPANGNIAPWQEAVVGAEVNGLLLNEVLVNVGDNVQRGQVLARFASGTIAADLAQANASMAEAKAAAIEAGSNASRAKSIQNTGALSNQQIEQYLSTEASTKARLEAAEATLNLQKIKLQQTTVVAPDNGVISARTATVGSVAAAGQELFKLVRQGRLEWRAELTSADVNKIRVGMKADLTLPDGHILTGKVRAIAPSIDSATRNALVYVDIPATTAKAGMYARGQFNLANTEAITLPSDAIVLRDGFSYAMQVVAAPKSQTPAIGQTPKTSHTPTSTTANRTARIVQVKLETGRRSGDLVEVLNSNADLNSELLNSEFVASGGAFLADGDTVTVVGGSEKADVDDAQKVQIGRFNDYKNTPKNTQKSNGQ